MRSHMDLVMKRKMNKVLRGVIGSGFHGTQEDLKELLEEKGFAVTQSTISRALKKMEVVKVSLVDGGSKYELKPQRSLNAYGGNVSNLVLSIKHNESMIVIKTIPGAAMFVAGFIDRYCKNEILGTVAGDDTIFAVPSSTKKIKGYIQLIEESIEKG